MPGTKQQLEQWEELIDAVDKTNIPVSLINRVVINFTDESIPSKNINVQEFRRQGYTDDEIEEIIAEIIHESNSSVYALDFFVDVESVASEVQKETKKILHKLL